MKLQCLSVVIPVYNEQDTLKLVVERVSALPFLQEVIIVDDCSSDETAAIAAGLACRDSRIKVARHASNQGKTSGLKTAFPLTTGDVVIVQDADLEYDPMEISAVMLTIFSNLLTNLNMTDVETGYKAFRGEIIRNMIISSSAFGFKIEVTAKAAKLKCSICEVPISYYGRTDGIAALWYIVRFNLLCSLKASYQPSP